MSYLSEALSLSNAGGIYFEGARVDSDERQLVLFVGLGGTGADALLRIKNQVANRMKLPTNPVTHMPTAEVPNNIAFLEFDTDANVMKKSCGNTRFAPHDREYCSLSVQDTAMIIAEAKQNKATGAEEWQWVEDDLKANQAADGAGGIRQVGRLMLFRNIQSVKDKINSVISRLSQDNPKASNLQIVVFAGISGGTGAGTFIDMGYICTDIGKHILPNTQVLGYLVMSDVNEGRGGQTENLRTNCFAGLKEIDYLLERAVHDGDFNQKYSPSYSISTKKPPYNHCHLLNASDTSGHVFSYDDIMQTLAENAFAYVAGEVAGNTPAMKSNYDNVARYLVTVAANAQYPATYRFLSVGASSLKIPYTEISTLLACRMFANLSQTMFANQPTDHSFNTEDLPNLGYTEQSFMSFITGENPRQPDLSTKTYSWDDIYSKGDRPWQAIFGNGGYIANCQAMMAKRKGEAEGEFEGKFRDYLKNNIDNPQKGPIYLARMVDSNGNIGLIATLRSWRERCVTLRNQKIGQRNTLEQARQQAFADNRDLGIDFVGITKGDKAKKYLQALQAETTNYLYGDIYAAIVEVFDVVIARLEVYRDNILKRLADTLQEMPVIFGNNLAYLVAAEREYQRNPDTSLLITPLQFENQYRNAFNGCVAKATSSFLKELKANLRFWIGRDIDGVDENVASGEDVVGFLAQFVSDAFNDLYNHISMQIIMDQMKGQNTLEVYVNQKLSELFSTAYSMYKSRPGIALPISEFTILSVPDNNPNLEIIAQNYVNQNLAGQKVIIKKSSERNSMYVVRVTAGYPLYSNACIDDLENTYETTVASPLSRMGVHLRSEWIELPSPIVEPAWASSNHTCERTKKHNAEVRENFLKCAAVNILYENQGAGAGTATLLLADPTIDLNHLALAGTTVQKRTQLDNVRGRLWNFNNPFKTVKLESCSLFKRNAAAWNGLSGTMQNIMENTARFPELCQALQEQAEKIDKINQIQNEIDNPAYYARALMLGLIYIEPVTNNVFLRKHANDPMPRRLLDGFEINRKDLDLHYVIYKMVRENLDKKAYDDSDSRNDNWRQIIDNAMRTQMNIFKANPQNMARFKAGAAQYQANFASMAATARNESLTQYDNMARHLEKVSQLCSAVAEEYERLKQN